MRGLIVLLALWLSTTPSPVAAQQTQKVYRVGVLQASIPAFNLAGSAAGTLPWLAELGYVGGQNIRFENRFQVGEEGVSGLAADLVRLKVDVIVTSGTPAIQAVKQATRTIPIVMVSGVDPVKAGFVASLARPGGNITGVTTLNPELTGKRLEILKDAVPGLRRVAVLWNPATPDIGAVMEALRNAARLLRLELQSLEVKRREDVKPSLEAAARQRAGGLVVLNDPLTWGQAKLIGDLAVRHRLPAIYDSRLFLSFGLEGLIFYGPSDLDISRRVAAYVDKLLKGAKPADLPVEQPTKFELVLNKRAAAAIGLKLPQSLLLRADTVIE